MRDTAHDDLAELARVAPEDAMHMALAEAAVWSGLSPRKLGIIPAGGRKAVQARRLLVELGFVGGSVTLAREAGYSQAQIDRLMRKARELQPTVAALRPGTDPNP